MAWRRGPWRLPRDEARRGREEADRAFEAAGPPMRELRTPFTLREAFADATLSKGQEETVEAIERFLADPAEQVFVLRGYAGTGKTFVVRGLADCFRAQGRTFRLCAPAGRAARVIEEKTGHAAATIHRTIYNLEKLVECADGDLEGSETFKNCARIAVNEDPANARST